MKKRISFLFFILFFAFPLCASSDFFIAQPLLNKIDKEYGMFAKRRALALVDMMNHAKDQDERAKLTFVNDFFNQTPYTSDSETYGVPDYWATRLEFIGKDRADCEDYVIAKYFTLKDLGISPKKLYMTYVKLVTFKASHLVLLYYETPKSIPLVLDNYNRKILPASQRNDLQPVYSFSGDELFLAKQTQIGKLVPASSAQKRPWNELVLSRKKGIKS